MKLYLKEKENCNFDAYFIIHVPEKLIHMPNIQYYINHMQSIHQAIFIYINFQLEDPDDEVEDSGAECVICMSDMRDTLILPCRHLCLCSTCAESLRYQASSCPICRSPFRALLQIRAMRKKQPLSVHTVSLLPIMHYTDEFIVYTMYGSRVL